MARSLPDLISKDLRVLFVGINPGLRSAAVGHHFAGHSNRFWHLLHDSALVPTPLTYRDDARLPHWGLGLTNIVARPSRSSQDIKAIEYEDGRRVLLAKIRRYRPQTVALLGVSLYPILFRDWASKAKRGTGAPARVRLGLPSEQLAETQVVVLPNPSGRNAHYTYPQMLEAFRRLRRVVRSRNRRALR